LTCQDTWHPHKYLNSFSLFSAVVKISHIFLVLPFFHFDATWRHCLLCPAVLAKKNKTRTALALEEKNPIYDYAVMATWNSLCGWIYFYSIITIWVGRLKYLDQPKRWPVKRTHVIFIISSRTFSHAYCLSIGFFLGSLTTWDWRLEFLIKQVDLMNLSLSLSVANFLF